MNLRDRILTDLQRNGAGSAGEIARRVKSKRQPVQRVLGSLIERGVVEMDEVPLMRMAHCRGTVVRRQRVKLYMLAVVGVQNVEDVLRVRWTG